ncbi:hypothetical protein [Achromobacter pestifer]|uniref:Uncharacterized protein n=1 Tax=Achromobacter pestifer TaxID=1353889 RepID=A0A6S6ZLI0_9BURK|nr:hypothetical protein [Achromobacter pestifer]CAB3674264.1 hypothetical protein LMG3431_04017 [Achromobacter pestifer]
MIPVSFPSPSFFILLTIGFFAGLALLGWAVVLVASAGHRRTVRKHWKKSAALFVVLAIPCAFYVFVHTAIWQIERESERVQAARRVTLEAPQTVAGTLMPAGTRLELQVEGDLDTYVAAEFPQPVPIFDVPALRVRRFLGIDYDTETYTLIGRYPRDVTVTGQGDQAVLGWQCDATHDIEFDMNRDGTMKGLSQCRLGSGNRAAGLDIPRGSILYGSDGTVYTDGATDPDRWRVEVKAPVAIKVLGLMVSEPRLYLDAERQLVRVSDTELACALRLGGLHYPAGTHLQTMRRGQGAQREAIPGVYVFSPWNGLAARRDGHEDVPEGMSVIQAFDGTVDRIVKNEAVGVFHFATFTVDDKEPEPPTRASCP